MLQKVFSNYQRYKFVAADNRTGEILKYLALGKFGSERLMRFRFGQRDIVVRTGSPDLGVAISSLGDEFRSLESAYPREAEGLILDVGGYIGTAALALARMYPKATIVTVEPSSANFEILTKNVSGHKNIHAENAALVARDAGKPIDLRNRGTGQWGFTVVESARDRQAVPFESVRTISVADILSRYGFGEIMILKMDIEGGEYDFFQDGEWLSRTKILIVELHERIVPGCEAAFMSANRQRYVYTDGGEKFISVGRSYFT